MRVAGAQEVGVQRVHGPAGLDGAGRRHQRLAGHLAAEDALAVLVRGQPPEEVDLDRLEVEQLHRARRRRPATWRHPRVRRLGYGPAPCPTTTFPDGFRWGTATAAHQIEGGNVNNDWWRWEHTPGSGCKESSGDACDSWHRWPEDVALLRRARLHRLPVLARVEPHRAGRRRVLHRGPRPLRPALRGPPGGRDRSGRHLPPLHHAAVAGRPGRLGERRDARALRRLLRDRPPLAWPG